MSTTKIGCDISLEQIQRTLSDALGRGLVQRVSGSGPLVSLAADGKVELAVKATAPAPEANPAPNLGSDDKAVG